ncbi:unnamed protein product [Larinioides sclopetarius]|uniref:Uncharacterized protein n=1 Tax=Larinioides sclopetarius TaxID=280406 RepID=A0AAV1ZYW9_9ARAC
MENVRALEDARLDLNLTESQEPQSTTKLVEFFSNKKEKEQTPATKEKKERCESSNANSLKSLEICNWRKTNKQEQTPATKEKKERCESSDANSLKSLEAWNWRSINKQEKASAAEETKETWGSSGDSSMNSLEGQNWRNKIDSRRLSSRNKGNEIAKSTHSFWSKTSASDCRNWRSKEGPLIQCIFEVKAFIQSMSICFGAAVKFNSSWDPERCKSGLVCRSTKSSKRTTT